MKKKVCVYFLPQILMIVMSCTEDPKPEIPKVTTTSIQAITQTSSKSGGTIMSDGGSRVTARGVCWSTHAEPTINDNQLQDNSGMESFSSEITGLSVGTPYYVRAYATNTVGTAYGETVSFTTLGPVVPVVTTSAISNVSVNTATSGGSISADGGAVITVRGICWSTAANPTVSGNKTIVDGAGGTFSSALTNLNAGTTYYVRAYASNAAGTGYGNAVAFTTDLVDIDGNVYKTVHIATQVWMIENLRSTHYTNGDVIASTNPVTLDIASQSSPKYQWAFNGQEANAAIYGRLYTWFATTDSRKVCPAGWHVPSSEEWSTLGTNVGIGLDGGGKLKEIGTAHWNSPNTAATNEVGFSALPGGQRTINGSFEQLGTMARWWTSTETTLTSAADRNLSYNSNFFYIDVGSKHYGKSIRCIKD